MNDLQTAKGRICQILPLSWIDGPGLRSVIFFQGCNLACRSCHNPETIPRHSGGTLYDIDTLLEELRPAIEFISGLTFSGGEVTLQAPYLGALIPKIRARWPKLHLLLDSNGLFEMDRLRPLIDLVDGVLLDLKVHDEKIHRELTGVSNQVVLENLWQLHQLGKLTEVRALLFEPSSQFDSLADLRHTATLVASLTPSVPLRLNPYRTHGVNPATIWSPENCSHLTLESAIEICLNQGIQQVLYPWTQK